MCGIAGLVQFNGASPDPKTLSRMGDRLQHRGPENEGIFVDGAPGFVHRRLQIIDHEAGAQPGFNDTRTIAVMFNGEIFNYREIRKRLEASGRVFRTQSDTEVIVHLYAEHGDLSFLSELNGQFAIVVHDLSRRITWIARDRTG